MIFFITSIGYIFRDDLMKVERWREKDKLRINRFRLQFSEEKFSSETLVKQNGEVDLRTLQNEFK